MRILSIRKFVFCSFLLSFSSYPIIAQNQNSDISQDPKFEQLLNEKRKINPSLTVNDSYKIQIYNGGSENAKKTLSEFKQEFAGIDATIVFNTPAYKVWIGNFKTRIEAEKNLLVFKKRYPNAFVIKPN